MSDVVPVWWHNIMCRMCSERRGKFMNYAEIKPSNRIHSKEVYHLPSGKYVEFVHDHQEKTFDAWEITQKGGRVLIESQMTKMEPFQAFVQRVISEH